MVRKRIRAVIFDFDDVIIKSGEKHLKAFLLTSKKFGLELKEEEIKKRFGKTAMEIAKEVLKGLKEKEIRKFLKRKEETYRRIIKKEGIRCIRGIKSLLNFLRRKKVKVAICSASSRRNILFPLRRLNLDNFFQAIVAAEDVKKHKPSPQPLLKVAEILKEDPRNCVYIGDSIYEMIAAKKAGMVAIGLLTGFYDERQLKMSGADYVCKSLGEVKKFLERMVD